MKSVNRQAAVSVQRTLVLGAFCLAAALWANGAAAAEGGLGLTVGAGRSDNILRTPVDRVSANMFSAATDFALEQQSRRIELKVDGIGRYLKYEDDIYDPDFVGSLVGTLNLRLVDGYLDWVTQDNFGEVRTKAQEIDTPINRETVNYFTTGPDMRLRLGTRNSIEVRGRYSSLAYETTDELNEDRYGGTLMLRRLLSNTSTVSVNATHEEVTFQDRSVVDDYTNTDYFLRYTFGSRRTTLGLDVGYTQIEFESGEDSSSLARLDLTRQLTPGSELRLELGRRFMNAGNSLRQLQGISGITLDTLPLQVAGDPFKTNYALLGWNFERNRTYLHVSAALYKEAHTRQPTLDRDWWVGTTELRRQVLPAMSVYVLGNFMRHKFKLPGGDYREISAGVGMDYRVGARVYLSLRYDRFDRTSDILDSEFDENQIWLRIGYGIGERARGFDY